MAISQRVFNDNIANSEPFKFKANIIGRTPNYGNTKDVEMAVPLKHLNSFWITLEMPPINCAINLMLTWPANCVITDSTGTRIFAITVKKLY